MRGISFLSLLLFFSLRADLWSDFQQIHQYHATEQYDYDVRIQGNLLYYEWLECRKFENGKKYFSGKYVKVHNPELYEKSKGKDSSLEGDNLLAYRTLYAKGGELFDIMEKFVHMPSKEEDPMGWFTALLEASGVPLVKREGVQ